MPDSFEVEADFNSKQHSGCKEEKKGDNLRMGLKMSAVQQGLEFVWHQYRPLDGLVWYWQFSALYFFSKYITKMFPKYPSSKLSNTN